jgi:hypothetical protein
MADDVALIIQLPTGSALDRTLQEDPPLSITSGRAAIEWVPADEGGRIVPPEGGRVVLSLLSPEALRREAEQVRREISQAAGDEPPVVVLEEAEYLREDELSVLVQAAERAGRTVLLCVLSSTT